MTRALFLAYYFPPIGGAGAQRPARFVRCLHELGAAPAVIAAPGAMPDRWSPHDASLLAEVPAEIEVRRAAGGPQADSRWRERGARWLWLESAWSEWWVKEAVERGREVEDVDVVYAIMPPYVTAAAAARLARGLGKPWVADLGDPWALDEMAIYPTALHRQLEIRRMRRLLGTAAAIVMTTPEAVRRIRSSFPELAGRTVVSIPMAYDGRDFAAPATPRTDGAFRIVHSGSFHTQLGREQRRFSRRVLRGGFRGVDVLPRSHVYLLEAVTRTLERRPDLAGGLEVLLAGSLSGIDRAAIDHPAVRALGYLPHTESVQLIRSAISLPAHARAPRRYARSDRPRQDVRVRRNRAADPRRRARRRRARPDAGGRHRDPRAAERRRGDGRGRFVSSRAEQRCRPNPIST